MSSVQSDLIYRPERLAWAWGQPEARAMLKASPEDFRVEEVLGFEPDGQGEHVFWRIEKTGLSTPELVQHLSSTLGIPLRLISWSGLKDKHAVTSQWIGLHVGVHALPDPEKAITDRINILETARNNRKLRRGVHRANRFKILLREFKGDTEALKARIANIQNHGVPNYFGPQRFGNDGANADRALAMFDNRKQVRKRSERSILLSAARSWIFNEVLSQRVKDQCWYSLTDGDVMMLHGSQVCFTPKWAQMKEDDLNELKQRLVSGDIYVTGPLWGRGEPAVAEHAASYEERIHFHTGLCQGLEQAGLKQERRALALRPVNLQIEPASGGGLMVEFELPGSGYATTVLRELVTLVS